MWVRRSEYNMLLKKVERMEADILRLRSTTTISTKINETEFKHEDVGAILCRLLEFLGIRQKYVEARESTFRMYNKDDASEEATEEGVIND